MKSLHSVTSVIAVWVTRVKSLNTGEEGYSCSLLSPCTLYFPIAIVCAVTLKRAQNCTVAKCVAYHSLCVMAYPYAYASALIEGKTNIQSESPPTKLSTLQALPRPSLGHSSNDGEKSICFKSIEMIVTCPLSITVILVWEIEAINDGVALILGGEALEIVPTPKDTPPPRNVLLTGECDGCWEANQKWT